ncbi:DUF3299 domain-containing protein [Marinobacterium jannaschii]|uniref:DUF3299 domain-containing protein n=1 Tax=Marinobacterium jannaschii TaxID=64970 RepID=UPI000480D791|nr:DUF3299 domain-containing protein [Marinobacterium jannaschii]
MFKPICLALALMFLAVPPLQAEQINGEEVTTVEWEALMPADFTMDHIFDSQEDLAMLDDFDPKAEAKLKEMMNLLQSAPVVAAMDGKMIRIPGFVVPLEGDGQRVTTFFLVPYFGACIHTPPPPSNQIIHVSYEPGTKVENLFDAVWITGKLRTEDFSHEMGAAGYVMEAYQIEPYAL